MWKKRYSKSEVDFREDIPNYSDEQLKEVLKLRDHYQPEAAQLAIQGSFETWNHSFGAGPFFRRIPMRRNSVFAVPKNQKRPKPNKDQKKYSAQFSNLFRASGSFWFG